MKKSEFDFSQPLRQSPVAILIIIYKTIKIIFRQIWPLILILLLGKSGNKQSMVFLTLIGVSLLSLIISIIGYFRFYYFLSDDHLIVRKGVLRKKNLDIPFERIQSVNFEQNIVQQIFQVVSLKIDTAGSGGKEFEFDAMDKDQAEALREIILTRKSESSSLMQEEQIKNHQRELVLKLGITDLLKVGLTRNHFRSLGLIALFFFWIYEGLRDIGVKDSEVMGYFPSLDPELGVFIFGFAFVVVASLVISLVNTVVRYFDLRLLRGNGEFRIQSGLLNRKEVAALDNKVQVVRWSQNLLQKLINIYDVGLKQASSKEVTSAKSIIIPGCYQSHVNSIFNVYFPQDDMAEKDYEAVSFHFFLRRFLYFGLIPVVIAIAVMWHLDVLDGLNVLIPLAWFSFLTLTSYLRYRKMKYGIWNDQMTIKGGVYGQSNQRLLVHKIQGVELHSNIYQRRRGLSSISMFTASGKITIPYIPIGRAQLLRDSVLYQVETSRKKWM